jgi:hypothetical protein
LQRGPTGGLRCLWRYGTALRAQLLLELLIAVLKLFDRAGQLTDLLFQLIDANSQFGIRLTGAVRLA